MGQGVERGKENQLSDPALPTPVYDDHSLDCALPGEGINVERWHAGLQLWEPAGITWVSTSIASRFSCWWVLSPKYPAGCSPATHVCHPGPPRCLEGSVGRQSPSALAGCGR